MIRRTALLAALVALGLLASACHGSPSADRSSSSSSITYSTGSSTPTSSTPSTSSSSSPGGDAAAQALALVPRYFQVVDAAFNNPALARKTVPTVAVYPDADNTILEINSDVVSGYKRSGFVTVTARHVQSVDLTAARPTVVVRACIDVRAVKETKNGVSVVPKNRKRYLAELLTIVNIQHLAPTYWRVASAKITATDTCS